MDPFCHYHRYGYISFGISTKKYILFFRRFLPLYCGFPSPSSSFPKTYNYIAPFKSSYFSIFSFLARKNYRVFVKRFVFVFFSKLFSLFFRDQALDLLVSVSYTHYCASTSDLSTLSSSRGLTTLRFGYLILRRVSRLDAFSVYLNRSPLPCYAAGATTGAQLVRSSRSSRTKDKPSQKSYAHDG